MKLPLLPALSAGAAIVSALALLIELRRPDPTFPAPAAETLSAAGILQSDARPALVLTELDARPLFTRGRRPIMIEVPPPPSPPVPSPPLPPPPPPPPPPDAGTGLMLLGILNGPGGRIAIIRVKSSSEVERLAEGAAADRWQIQQILPDHVMLTIEGATQRLDFPAPAEGRSKTGGMRAATPSVPHPPRHP